jgi:hypothetical protein
MWRAQPLAPLLPGPLPAGDPPPTVQVCLRHTRAHCQGAGAGLTSLCCVPRREANDASRRGRRTWRRGADDPRIRKAKHRLLGVSGRLVRVSPPDDVGTCREPVPGLRCPTRSTRSVAPSAWQPKDPPNRHCPRRRRGEKRGGLRAGWLVHTPTSQHLVPLLRTRWDDTGFVPDLPPSSSPIWLAVDVSPPGRASPTSCWA